MKGRLLGVVGLLAAVAAQPGVAQTASLAASRWLTDPHVMDYRLSVARWSAGPFALSPYVQLALQGPRSGGAALVGAGGDVTLRFTDRARPYLVGGASGGFFDFERQFGLALWGSWSAGVGYELARVGPIGLAVEARYQALSRERTAGGSIGLRLGSMLGRRRSPPGPPEPAAPAPSAADEPSSAVTPPPLATTSGPASSGLAGDVVAAALDVMGTPYRWGGTDANGFDCSGLILYAYAQVGVELPRRSADQAKAGRPVVPHVDDLAPGDILVFSATIGGGVTHVGLYLGDGRFVHSATGGVRIGRLAADDPEGRWWVERWIGARRVLGAR